MPRNDLVFSSSAHWRRLRSLLYALTGAVALAGLGATPGGAYPVVEGERHCVVGVAGNDVLNIRARPSASAPILGVARPGACDVVVGQGCRSNWCPVTTPTATGWASREFLGMVSPARYCVVGVAPTDRLNVRLGPSTRHRTLASLKPGQCGLSLAPPYRSGRWARIVLPGARPATGWVHGRYLSGQ